MKLALTVLVASFVCFGPAISAACGCKDKAVAAECKEKCACGGEAKSCQDGKYSCAGQAKSADKKEEKK